MDNTLEAKIRKSIEKYFKFYAPTLNISDYKTKMRIDYIFACCKRRISEGCSPINSPDSIDRFVLETVFTCCIDEGSQPVETPLGNILAYPTHHSSGIFVDISNDDGLGTMLACIEYLPPENEDADDKQNGSLQICVYGDCVEDEPTYIKNFANVSAAFD